MCFGMCRAKVRVLCLMHEMEWDEPNVYEGLLRGVISDVSCSYVVQEMHREWIKSHSFILILLHVFDRW